MTDSKALLKNSVPKIEAEIISRMATEANVQNVSGIFLNRRIYASALIHIQ